MTATARQAALATPLPPGAAPRAPVTESGFLWAVALRDDLTFDAYLRALDVAAEAVKAPRALAL